MEHEVVLTLINVDVNEPKVTIHTNISCEYIPKEMWEGTGKPIEYFQFTTGHFFRVDESQEKSRFYESVRAKPGHGFCTNPLDLTK